MIAEIQTGRPSADLFRSLSIKALPTSANVWPLRPLQIVSLLDMFKFRLFDLLEATAHLEIAQQEAQKKSESGVGKLSDKDQVFYQQDVNRMRVLCEKFELESTLDQLGRIDITITKGDLDGAYKAFTNQTQQVWECLKTDLDKRLFLFMPLVEAQYYDQDELFGPEVKARFPEANKEIVAAGNCYATGNNTACVFHLMRAVELGARTMFKGMKAAKHLTRPMTLCTWGELTFIECGGQFTPCAKCHRARQM